MDYLLYLGFASFLFNINKNEFIAQYQGKRHIIFFHRNEVTKGIKYEPYQVKRRSNLNCGELLINNIKLFEKFGHDAENIKLDCQRVILSTAPTVTDHCRPCFRKEVCVKMYNEEELKCLNDKK